MRKIINQFKEPIYKDDLKRVLLYCMLNAVLFGAFAGALQFFAFTMLGVGFSVVIYIIAYMIGKELRDRVFTYHILYSILGVIFFLIGCYFYSVSLEMFFYRDVLNALSFEAYIDNVLGFLNIKSFFGMGILNNILDIIIMSFCISTVWKMSTYRK